MKVVCHPEQGRHYPPHFLVNGVFQPNPERPERQDRLLQAALAAGCRHEAPLAHGMEPIAAIHDGRYLAFLERAWERWAHIEDAAPAVTPNIHPDRRDTGYPASVVAQAGYHMSDASAPIAEGSWTSILWSAWSAVHSARLLLDGERSAYALCRPPGHHAFSDMAGGFCYLNNSAIAAQVLRRAHDRLAILDVDLHHGNGTQAIFYERDDVLTVSIHADPERFYPFFWGYPDEFGAGQGEGFNLNLPLPRGAGDEPFLRALDRAIGKVAEFAPGALVVALGLDASEADPFGGLRVTTRGFQAVGRAIADGLPVPTLLVQEGGYLSEILGPNLAGFLDGFHNA